MDHQNEIQHPWLALMGPIIGAFVGMLSETSLNIALPQLSQSLNIGNATLQWIVTGYMLVIGIILPLSSLLTKWFTTRQIITTGIGAFLIGAIISALAPNFPILLTGRMIQGIGTGTILPLMFTVAMNIFPPQKMGTAIGVCSLVIMFAPAVGPTLTGFILAKLSWNWVFWLFVPVLLVALFFDLKFLPNISKLTRPKVDFASVILSIFGFGLLVMGFSFAARLGWVLGCLAGGILIVAVYAYRQLHHENPILNLKVFKHVAFTKGTLLVMIDFGIILSAMYLLPQYIQRGMLVPVALTGIIMLPGGIVNAAISGLAGRMFDKYGAKILATIGFIIAIMLLNVSTHTSVAYIIAAHVILMIGCPLAMSPSQTHALNSLEIYESADGSTIINTLQQIVGAIATAMATSLLQMGITASHDASSAVAFTHGVHNGIIFTIVLAVIGLLIALSINNKNELRH